MMNEIKSRLTEWGKELRNFCEQHPQVTFNAPAEDQEEFRESLDGFELTEQRIGMQSIFFTNKPMMGFFQQLEAGDMIMMFVGAGKDVFLTVLAMLEDLYRTEDIPVNPRIDFHHTKTFKREFGRYQSLWLNSVVAATCVKNLSRQMCIVDSKGEIFKEKAVRHGISPNDYHQMYPKLKLLDTGERVCEVSNGVIYESPIFRVLEVSGSSLMVGERRIQPDTRLTSCSLNHIGLVKPEASIKIIPRM